jgi:hypothetical protein
LFESSVVSQRCSCSLSLIEWHYFYSGVGESIHHDQAKHKARLNRQYLSAIRRLVEVITHKTHHIEMNDNNNDQNLQAVLEHFHRIDDQCRSAEERLGRNRNLPSSAVVTQFLRELEELENRDNDSVVLEKSFKAEKYNSM